MKQIRRLVILMIVFTITIVFVGCTKNKEIQMDSNNPVHIKMGVMGGEGRMWTHIKEQLKERNIELEIVSFSDFSIVNTALADGEIDMCSMQHYAYFNNFIKDYGLEDKLVVFGETVIAPMGLYSKMVENVSDIKENSKIVIPNDQSSSGRALILLRRAGIIDIDYMEGTSPTLQDITSNPLSIEFIEMDTATTARALEDADAVVINSGMASMAGLIPTKDSIFLEPIDNESKPFINIIVVKAEDKENETYKKVLDVYHTDEVKAIIEDEYKGSQIPTW